MKKLLPYRVIEANVDRELVTLGNWYTKEKKHARAAICQSILQVAGEQISDNRAAKRVRKIMKIVLRYDFHVGISDFSNFVSEERLKKAVERLIFDQEVA